MLKKITTILFSLLIANSANADDWTGKDKNFHLVAGTAISSVTTFYFKDPKVGFLVGTGAGLAKEIYDSQRNGDASSKDLVVTMIGAYIGSHVTGLYITPIKKDSSLAQSGRYSFDGIKIEYSKNINLF